MLAAGLLSACSSKDKVSSLPPPKPVGVYTLQAQSLDLTTDLPGRTVAFRHAEVRPQVEGIVERRLFTEGATVTEGQQLYQIDDEKYQATYRRAQVNLENARQQFDRYGELVKKGSVSKQQFDDAEANWKLAKAEAELARIDLTYTKVLAPVTGRIGRSAVSEGALVSQAQTQLLATIQQIDPMYVDITQPVGEMLRLQDALAAGKIQQDEHKGAQVVLLLENGRSYQHVGSLNFSEVSVDQSTGSVTLRAVVPNPDGRLLPGMFVHARLTQGRKENAILVPQQAVVRDATGEAAVWVVDNNNQIELRQVSTARTVGNMWLIRRGLESGESVVTEGLLRLRSGMTVDPVPASNVNPILDFSRFAASDY
jgi:membrane fusion protein (multidrug efflux system)